MPKELDFENLRLCLDRYQANHLYIRLKGSHGGGVKINEKIGSRTLDFRKDWTGLYFLIDSKEVFHFKLESYGKGFLIAYERFENVDGIERIVVMSKNENPDDPTLPEPKYSVLRSVIDSHLLEIAFNGKMPIKFHSWWNKKAEWKYWTISK